MTPASALEHYDGGELKPTAVLEAERWRLLQEVVRFARDELPFYRRHWSLADADASAISWPDDFRSLPVVRKRDLINAMRRVGSLDIGLDPPGGDVPSNIVLTSGTSGFHTFSAITHDNLQGPGLLAQLRELWAMRVRPGMRVLSVSPAWHALGLFESRALTELGAVPVLSWGTLTTRFIGNMLEAVQALRPEHVLITARAARMLLAECERRDLDSRRVFASTRYLGCAGEFLSARFRQYLIDRFEVEDVYERGGSGDGMFGGAECFAHRGHHISADVHYVEVLLPDGEAVVPGQRGAAVVTNLGLGRSLYVRFDTEDVAAVVPGDCPCGRTHPVIEFYGRLDESVRVGHRLITPSDVRAALDETEAARFRPFSIRRDGECVVIAMSGVETLSPAEEERTAEAVAGRLNASVAFEPASVADVGWKDARVRSEALDDD